MSIVNLPSVTEMFNWRSEHERHSQSCRFIRNNANPNVPLAVTMSALSPFPHHIQPRSPSKFVIATTSNCEWIAIATEASSRVHLWRCDRVVHVSTVSALVNIVTRAVNIVLQFFSFLSEYVS